MKNFMHCAMLCLTLSLGNLFSAQTVLVDHLNSPYDVVANSNGDLYISDTYNQKIIKTKSDGTEPVVIRSFAEPVFGILIKNDKLFALTSGNLIKMDLDGNNLEILTSVNKSFYLTSGRDGFIYFTSQISNNIRKIKEDGTMSSVIVSDLDAPMGITYDSVSDMLYYAEMGSDQVYSIKADGTDKKFLAAGFNNPHNLRLDASKNLYIADAQGNSIKKLSADRKVLTSFPNTTLNAPTSIFITKNGKILVADAWGAKIRVIDAPEAASLNFDGVDDYISGTNNRLPQGSNEVTIEAVIRAPSLRSGFYTYSSIFNFGSFSPYNRFCLMLLDGKLTFMGDGHGLVSNANLFDDKWHHVAVSYKNNEVKLFLDGEVLAQNTLNNLNISGYDFQIGASYRNDVDELFEGDIDEIRVWNRALSQNELKNSKGCEIADANSQDGLVSYFKFNQGKNEDNNTGVSTLIDDVGNSNSVILNNFALEGTTSNWLLASPILSGQSCPKYVSSMPCAVVTLPDDGTPLSHDLKISWTPVDGADTYKVFVGTSPGNYDVSRSYVNNTDYYLEGLSEETIYYVKVVPDSPSETAIGCTEKSFKTGSIMAVNDFGKDHISLFPNPFTTKVNISDVDSVANIYIHDYSGKMIKEIKPAKLLDMSSLTSGPFIIKLKLINGSSKSFKIIKK